MDAARVTYTHAQIAVKSCTFRYNAAVSTLTTAKTAFKTALTNLKADASADAKAVADKAAQIDEEKAKQALNAACAARSRRINKHDKFEIALPGDDAQVKTSAAEYIQAAETTFADISAMKTFPEPEASPCGNTSCIRNAKNRALAACPCNIKAAFVDLTGKELKAAKKTFSPERFGDIADFQAKASEICSAINKLIASQTVNQQPRNHQGKAFDTSRRIFRGY